MMTLLGLAAVVASEGIKVLRDSGGVHALIKGGEPVIREVSRKATDFITNTDDEGGWQKEK